MRSALLLLSVVSPILAQVHVQMTFDSAPTQSIVAAIETQVKALYRGTDISFHWMEGGDIGPIPGHLLSLHFYGSCSGAGYEPRSDGLALAWTVKEHGGEVLPFIGLDCDLTRGIIGQQADPIFGRALGYLVAHEIFHALTKTVRHGRGLMKSKLCTHDLLGNRLAFDAQELAILAELQKQLVVAAGE
jgi:hypothetical protein